MLTGRTFGDFTVGERIGEGGGGEVYRAHQITLGREAVIKVMSTSRDSRVSSDRFLREARLASQLDHPFAAHIYGFGSEPDGILWIAMELVRGMALSDVIKTQGPVPLARFVPFFERLCEVMQAAHEQGIVHRDIKPGNVMVLSRAGRLLPKLLDLGIARRGSDVASEGTDGHTETSSGETLATGATASRTLASQLVEAETSELTRIGAVIGTPAYMAPEQWVDASSADPRSDLYSLTVLAYQALTGELPFKGKNVRQLARAHFDLPFPRLPESLPSGLSDVLARGAAKQPVDRYSSALVLGAAVRAASSIGVEPLALPQLDDRLRETVLSEAPQPIAEAMTLLESARTPKQQLDAFQSVQRVAIRHLAIVALSARARVGPGTADDSPQVIAALHKLAEHHLDDAEWFALAKELCRPFALRKSAHPLPELVGFFFSVAPGVHAGAGALAFDALATLPVPGRSANDAEIHAALLSLVPALGQLLEAMTFVFDYALVVRDGEDERWMGTRRLRRSVQRLADGVSLPPRLAVLVDSVGLPVLTLAPLLQVFSPGAGLPDELFFIEGAGRRGARLVALPSAFERQDEEVWPWFSKNLFDLTELRADQVARAQAAPYKGLSSFTPQDADNYFGREQEAESFANRLRSSPLLAVVGPSGSGKSSFVLAGVLPLLPAGWKAVVMRPGADPLQALAAKLGTSPQSTTADTASAQLLAGESLLLVVDQFEELITLCPLAETREVFAALLVELAERSDGRIRVVLTLRDDFLIKVQQLGALRDRLSPALQLLGTPAKEDLLRVVTEPARRVGYGFDDHLLPAKMVDEVLEYPGALALLSFTASQLWELRDRHLLQMRSKTYEALGGVAGALAQHAEATLAGLSTAEAKLVREAFRHLVTSQGTRAVLSRKEMLDVLGASPSAQSVLEKLLIARLLVSSDDPGGDDRIEIIHEALIVSWPRLAQWLREDADTARLRDALRVSAKQWADRGRSTGLLWRKETLAEYRAWRLRYQGRLTALEEEFAESSMKDETRARTIRRSLAIGAIAVLVIGFIVVFRAYRQADASALDASARLVALRQEQARVALVGLKPLEALAYLKSAQTAQPTSALQHLNRFANWLARGRLNVIRAPGPLRRVVISGDSRGAAAFGLEGGLELDLQTMHTTPLPKGNGTYTTGGPIAVASRETSIVMLEPQGERKIELGARTWELFAGPRGFIGTATAMEGKALAVAHEKPLIIAGQKDAPLVTTGWNDDGTRIVAFAGLNATSELSFKGLWLHDAIKDKPVWHALPGDVMTAAHFLANGDVIAGSDTGLVVCLMPNGHIRWSLNVFQAVDRLLINSDRTALAVQAGGGIVFIEPSTGIIRRTLQISTDALTFATWADDGHLLVSTLDGATTKLNAATGAAEWTFVASTQAVSSLAYVAATQTIVATSRDATLVVFDERTSGYGTIIDAGVLGVWAAPSDPGVLYATTDGWFDFKTGHRVIDDLVPQTKAVAAASFGALNALADGQALTLVDRASRRIVSQVPLAATPDGVWFDPKGQYVAAALSNGRVVVIDTSSRPARHVLQSGTMVLTRGVFTSDSKHLVLGTDRGTLEIFSVPGFVLEREVVGTQVSATDLRESNDPATFLSLALDGTVVEFDRATVTEKRRINGISGKGTNIIGAAVTPGLLSVYLETGEWLMFDRAQNTMLSKFAMPVTLGSVAVRADASTVLAVTKAGALIELPAWLPPYADPCGTPYALEGERLVVKKEAVECGTASTSNGL